MISAIKVANLAITVHVCHNWRTDMPIYARFLTLYIEQYDESYVFKNIIYRSIYSIAYLACLWAIIWYSSMLYTRPKEPGAMRVATSEVHTESKKVPRTNVNTLSCETELYAKGCPEQTVGRCDNKSVSRKAKNEYMNSDVGDVMSCYYIFSQITSITCQVCDLYTTCMYFAYVRKLVSMTRNMKRSLSWVGNIKMHI